MYYLNKKIWLMGVMLPVFTLSLLCGLAKTDDGNEEGKVIAKIYEYKPQEGRGSLVGTVTYEKGVTNMDSDDEKLKEIFSKPYMTLAGERQGDMFISKVITYQPNTYEHAKALVLDLQVMRCRELGYMSEVIELK